VKIIGLVVLTLLTLLGCSNKQPVPKNPVTYTGVPQATAKVTGTWKMGEFDIGYRIITDEYVFITDGGGLYGQDGQSFGGPGMVHAATVSSFAKIVHLAEWAKASNETITFKGDLVLTDEGEPYYFEDKKVALLFSATYQEQDYEVNRRPWDN
jgi:hypothetical protein